MRITYTLTVKTFDQYTTDGRLIFRRQSMVSVSAERRPLYQPKYMYLPIVGQLYYVNHHSADISVDTSVDMSTDISVDISIDISIDILIDILAKCRHSADMSIGTLVECRSICRPRCRPIYRSRGEQNTHDPKLVHINKPMGKWIVRISQSEH